MMRSGRISLSAYGCGLLLFCTPLWGAGPRLEAVSSPPGEVSEQVKESLSGEGIRILEHDKILGEFWFPREFPTQGSASTALGVSFGQLKESAFLGVARFPSGWSDYRGRAIAEGTYTLRYGVQPADGNHMGVSFYRDFLLLLPASVDVDPAALYSFDELMTLSTQASRTPHPAVLSLFPIYEKIVEPKLLKNDLEQWTAAVPLQSLTFGLVIQGSGE